MMSKIFLLMNIISKNNLNKQSVCLPKHLHIIPCFRNKLRLYFIMHIYFDVSYFRTESMFREIQHKKRLTTINDVLFRLYSI